VQWLVDGYNVIRRDPELRAHEGESLEAGRKALLRLLAQASGAVGDSFTVVFDGARMSGGEASQGRIQVVFSRPPRTADDELMSLARRLREGAVVVSSDRKIQDAARRAGCPVLTAEQFLDGLTAAAGDDRDEADDDRPREKRGNPRRLSKDARAAQRALRRLRES
jgi:predicted RNA-binding protein with PIN domain